MPKIYIHEKTASQRLVFFCPACETSHSVIIQKGQGVSGQVWEWNGSSEEPTLTQPVIITVDDSSGVGSSVCRSTITEGLIKFAPECTHQMSGQLVPLPEF